MERKRSSAQYVVTCEPLRTYLKRSALRARYQRVCRHSLYNVGCNLIKDNFLIQGNVLGQVANVISVNGLDLQPNGYFVGGYIVLGSAKRAIIAHVGNNITLTSPFDEVNVGATANVYPGCDHTFETCRDQFNNEENFGGFPWIPGKNPFGGTSIV